LLSLRQGKKSKRIMKQQLHLAGLAACIAVLSLVGCASSGAPHPGTGVGSTLGSHARPFNGVRGLTVPNHVLTLDVFTLSGQVDPNIAAPYLDYAEVTYKDVNAYDAAGIKTILYTDPNRTYVGQPMYTQDETTFAHDCNGVRITVKNRRFVTYQMDVRAPHLEPLWSAWVYGILNAGYNFNYIFEDAANNVHNDTGVPCGYNEPAWTAASNANDTLLGQPIIYNGLGTLADGVNNPPPSLLLNPTTWGGNLEGCYGNISLSNPVPKTAVWHNFETTELTMSNLQKPFFCRGLSSPPGETAYAQRIYQYASFLLTYDLGTSAISEKFETPSHLSVFPEETLVALQPLILSPSSMRQLKSSHWTFGRQYAACYLAGTAIGSCAAVVNADNASVSHPFPWPGVYNHTLVLSGSGIMDGGTASATGPPPPATLPGASAIIAIQ
jgi:hypothetical protein